MRFGKPVLKGTRTTVAKVLEMLANGMSTADSTEDFPVIGPAQVGACLLRAPFYYLYLRRLLKPRKRYENVLLAAVGNRCARQL
ncbi:DUF433 domain-containing protein [Hymenobacter coccineus]|uniref:DUF433 domain-containing protein n=1 Tax=Hymenobacter coccineus TaxID=1908235 RepID=UPI0021CD7F38|nr:DUF433 domain-containing protein [Hymenobacter coccineus]